MECARYYLQLSLSFKAFVDWWVFVLQQFSGDVSVHSENSVLHGTQVKISIIALIAANFSLNGPRCRISQQAGGQEHLMVPQMEMKGNRGKKKKKNTQRSFSIQPDGRACNLKKKKETGRNTAEIDSKIQIKHPGHEATLSTRAPDLHSDPKMSRYPARQPHSYPSVSGGVNRVNPNKTPLSTSEGHDHACQQTLWGAFLCAFLCLFNEITWCIVCFSQTQL